ncbi:MAG: hypothetical protein ABR925_00465 [Acidimicrobiales bacterium]
MQVDANANPCPIDPGREELAARPRLRVEPFVDPVVDEIGHDPRSAYVETFWLPVLGPSTTWLLRHLNNKLEESPEGLDLDVEDTARALGLGERLSPNAPFARTVKRCVDFNMAEWRGPEQLAVRRRLPPLANRHLRRLPESLRLKHESEQVSPQSCQQAEGLRQHGCRLALSLVDLGEDQETTEMQLRRWRFQPSLASECAAWAIEERARRAMADTSPTA